MAYKITTGIRSENSTHKILRVIGNKQQTGTGSNDKGYPDNRFLNIRPQSFCPVQRNCSNQGCRDRSKLHFPAFVKTRSKRDNDAQPGNLRYRQVNKNNTARQHFTTEWNMRRKYQQAG
jgi:hypothetical protein